MDSFNGLSNADEAAILSRICLMVGSDFDDESLLARLEIDCGLKWSPIELGIAKLRLGLNQDLWMKAYHHVITVHHVTPAEMEVFDQLRKEHPGEAGFFLGRALPKVPIAALQCLWPQGSRAISSGIRIAQLIPPGLPRARVTRLLHRCRSSVQISGISVTRLLDLVQPMGGAHAAMPVSMGLAKLQANAFSQIFRSRRRMRAAAKA